MMQTMLIQHWWPNTITANLWHYVLRITDALNATPILKFKDGHTPLESFASTKIASNPKDWHHFGCPAYTLFKELQTDTSIHHKWKARSRVGVCLGRSPHHASDVSLVLNLETGQMPPISCQVGFYIPDAEAGRSKDVTIITVIQVQFCGTSTSCKQEQSLGHSHQKWQDYRSTSICKPCRRFTRWNPQHAQRKPPEEPKDRSDVLPPIRLSICIQKPVARLTHAI